MKNTISFPRHLLVFGLPVLLVLFLIILVNSPYYDGQSLSLAVTLDFVLTIPVLCFFLIRKTSIPKFTIASAFVIGLLIATFVLPEKDQSFLEIIKTFALPVFEIGVVSFISFNFFQLRRKYQSLGNDKSDFYELLQLASQEIFPGRVGNLLASEIAVVYYSFFNWKNKEISENEMTYHKRSGSREMLGAFTFVILIEAFAMHLLIENWSSVAAWVLTFLSLYTALQVFALIRSMKKRPHLIRNGELHLRYGFMTNTKILISDIESIEFTRKHIDNDGFKSLSIVGDLDGHNVILHLKIEYELSKIYGLKDRFTSIGFFVDEKEHFKEKLQSQLNFSSLE